MSEGAEQAALVRRVDASMRAWRQGDCCLDEQWFVHRLQPEAPITTAGQAAADQGAQLAEVPVDGVAVLTQTCDLVRSCAQRPFVEIAPLVEVDEGTLHEIERGRRPGYASIPGVADRRLVADLDRVMTVEKAVVANWSRTPGCGSDEDARRFAWALARKRSRFAFPDDFTQFARSLQDRLKKKHDRNSDEGRGLAALDEIRVEATPSWDAERVELMFWFVRGPDDPAFSAEGWPELLTRWRRLVPASGRFGPVHGQICTLDDLTAADLRRSDLLDLDHLSLSD